ncbi:hypothetical protein CY34DRAFT_476559 [Suillus luteus UH-Slu-Lm8-n1]|uniref:Uncharacterized protein n=1 Tax=Suillus luteus UH-Slu-Lm8-n1 TaxID=930992 RepID=A0A0C9ZI81_9AGAM|nr:hypothetical protein CY34DRAFT_476559 [Suillus luteus UH-Slu-Lm8-n1]
MQMQNSLKQPHRKHLLLIKRTTPLTKANWESLGEKKDSNANERKKGCQRRLILSSLYGTTGRKRVRRGMYEHMWHVQMRVIKCYALFYRGHVCPPKKRMYPSKAKKSSHDFIKARKRKRSVIVISKSRPIAPHHQ